MNSSNMLHKSIATLGTALATLATVHRGLANICLAGMLCTTALIIVLRPFGMSIYWLWPWSMQLFVWMTFFGFFAVYHRGSDIEVDFIVRRLGRRALIASWYFARLTVLFVMVVMLIEMPKVIALQRGVIDGVVTPWGTELERYTLSVPLMTSCMLIAATAVVDMLKSALGLEDPHRLPSEATGADR
ncbi:MULTISPECIES: TRAP transporter small permease [unclassified Roseitalea]|uniref:TRAP transporter small permease n=1 Tax=unclassified Roseitalea TaxID=2639107 RepID=UPI00273F234D|nr:MULTISPECIES: TRAP transporter small permease [unclassified Roseitalea]